jgi:hypothetical protein
MNRKLFTILIALLAVGALALVSKRPPSTYNIPDTKEAKDVMKAVENAYDIEAEALYTLDIQNFPTVFINDPRFPVSPGTLDTIRELTNNPSLESAGWLDYKLAYYSWISSATLHAENVKNKAKAENRELTDEEKKSFVDSNGRIAPVRSEDPIRKRELKFLSVDINGDIAKVILDDGPTTIELTLVSFEKEWYIAALEGVAFHP